MAEAAVDSEAAHVMLVAERHRLLDGPEILAAVIGARVAPSPADAGEHQGGQTQKRDARCDIRPWLEDRRHAPSCVSVPGVTFSPLTPYTGKRNSRAQAAISSESRRRGLRTRWRRGQSGRASPARAGDLPGRSAHRPAAEWPPPFPLYQSDLSIGRPVIACGW